ncbi:hypothetical protein AAZX31_03G121000 [Glycine max]
MILYIFSFYNWLCGLFKAFNKAWQVVCSTGEAILVVPQGNYLLKPIRFSGPCKPIILLESGRERGGRFVVRHLVLVSCSEEKGLLILITRQGML